MSDVTESCKRALQQFADDGLNPEEMLAVSVAVACVAAGHAGASLAELQDCVVDAHGHLSIAYAELAESTPPTPSSTPTAQQPESASDHTENKR